jgi:hypothetical protein
LWIFTKISWLLFGLILSRKREKEKRKERKGRKAEERRGKERKGEERRGVESIREEKLPRDTSVGILVGCIFSVESTGSSSVSNSFFSVCVYKKNKKLILSLFLLFSICCSYLWGISGK